MALSLAGPHHCHVGLRTAGRNGCIPVRIVNGCRFRRAGVIVHADASAAAEKGAIQDTRTRDLFSEFLGCALFQVLGGCAPAALAAPANGLSLSLLIFAFGNVSGAHLNPAVTLMLLLTKQVSAAKALAYMVVQIAGCCAGALLCSLIVPGVTTGLGAPGTFAPAAGLTTGALFGWESMLTFTLCWVVYSAAIAKPGFGVCAPLAIGLAVFCGAMAGGQYSGAIMNPARALGPALVYGLSAATTSVYVLAQLAGGVLAASLAGLFYGEKTAKSALAAAATDS